MFLLSRSCFLLKTTSSCTLNTCSSCLQHDEASNGLDTGSGEASTAPVAATPVHSADNSSAPHAANGLGPGPSSASDPRKLNLRSLEYRLDKRAILPGCKCFACQNHSRAYIHHLLHVQEMLAEVLLEMHNTHHYMAMFEAVRQAIQQGRFQQYRQWFKAQILL